MTPKDTATAATRPISPAPRVPAVAFVLVALVFLASVLAAVALALGLTGCFESPAVNEPELPTGKSRAVAETLLPSVVDVRAWGGGIEEGRVTIGTGVVVEEGGFIVTNDHVLTGNGDGLAAEIEVVVDGGDRLDALLVGRDPAMDLALLQVERGDLPVAKFYRRDARVGQAVLAIGAPRTL
ncbi:MAG: trypsin-like peptidase domain-containing protein, partial [Thermoleophilia bacterium]|nr:trypsin-like peptidase domain-containing protein [Thermoleophilia bacterium]